MKLMSDESHAPLESRKDRRTGLIVFGIIQIGLGLLALAAFAISVFSFLVLASGAPGAPGRPSVMIPGVSLYAVAGAVLITLGIGSIRCRRWAPPLTLVMSWLWLVIGGASLLIMVGMTRIMARALPQTDPMVNALALGCTVVFFAIFGLIIPGAFILFYRGPHVAQTCRARDPRPRWTDDFPLPLLTLVAWIGFGGISTLLSISYGVLPLGSMILTGAPAMAVSALIGIILVATSIGLFRRSMVAWWTAVISFVLGGIFGTYTFATVDMSRMQELMGITAPPQAHMPDLMAMYANPWVIGMAVLLWGGMLALIVYARRYVRPSPSQPLF